MFQLLKKFKKKKVLIKKHNAMLLHYASMWCIGNDKWNDYVHRIMMAELKALDKLKSL